MTKHERISIIGGGHIGAAIAEGLAESGLFRPENITITRRKKHLLAQMEKNGFIIKSDNIDAVKSSEIIIIAVQPQQMNGILEEIKESLQPDRHVLISIVSGAGCSEIMNQTGKKIPIIRAMPNTAIAIKESMTCISTKNASPEALEIAKSIFDSVGMAMVIDEELMTSATALCACGIAFFMRAIRAASQGGIEIGFHAEEALPMAAQTAKGAAALILAMKNHPEMEIDKVTTPKGCTISGLNEMEHRGFSSALIKGIITSSEKADRLYKRDEG